MFLFRVNQISGKRRVQIDKGKIFYNSSVIIITFNITVKYRKVSDLVIILIYMHICVHIYAYKKLNHISCFVDFLSENK